MSGHPEELDAAPADSIFESRLPIWLRVLNWSLGGFFALVLVITIRDGSANWFDVVVLAAASGTLVLQPLRARTVVTDHYVEITTLVSHRVIGRQDIERVRAGFAGPVLVLDNGKRVRTVAPLPKDSWLASLHG